MRKTFLFTYAVMLAVSTPVFAADLPVAAVGPSIADRFADLQAQKALNRVQMDLLKQQVELKELREKVGGDPVPKPAKAHVGEPPLAASPPRVVAILGSGEKMTASLFANGMNITAKAGDMLPGGWQIRSIVPDAVTFSKSGQLHVVRP